MKKFNEEYVNGLLFESPEYIQSKLDRDFPGYTVEISNSVNTIFRDANGKSICVVKTTPARIVIL